MSENRYSHENNSTPIDEVKSEFLVGVIAEHWRDYYSRSNADRMGDEEFWDSVLRNSVVEMGIDPSSAESLCAIAKLEAQF